MSLFSAATSRSTASSSVAAAVAAAAARQIVLRLYKDCLTSALLIPDPSQRVMYISYIREGFRSQHNARYLVPDSIEAKRSIRDATEQLERMNYYHSIRKMKEQGDEFPPTSQSQQQHDQQRGNQASSQGSNDNSKKETIVSSASDEQVASMTTNKDTQQRQVVETWLLTALPELHSDDLSDYSQRLLDDGFDSLSLLESSSLRPDEDLHFMKKGHQRAIIRTYYDDNDDS
mmetsp:Transcript_2388/g.3765  ORF Transcript_2388/g.3765 Transcript_2388/m.3765 type:complete len:231 (+) Transcript_2388:60-752(+)|eukprot:CAMPEP_0119006454 /NCGR_PEP_ID=MMETSP1176-20130426/2302_1 /TAXON_ID=265551 /ORGANISM="Synedropsis recta cf, Strain CCMP1620" /LENGTH=230 /DNA_ID=CAMNT_0006958367 /DNA_START=72 /DNA_END=764 /DNA_ORIENTATION=+